MTDLPLVQTPGEHRIKNALRDEPVVLEQEAQVVVRAVDEQFPARQRGEERPQIHPVQRIHQHLAGAGADLEQADIGLRARRGLGKNLAIGWLGRISLSCTVW